MMKEIILNKNDIYFQEKNFFLIKKGKVITREILDTGKVIKNEICLTDGELIGNYFELFNDNKYKVPDFYIEIEALEDETIIEEIPISNFRIEKNMVLEKILIQLIKKSMLKFFSQLYNTKGYIMTILKLFADKNGKISREYIKYTNFNISKSQFYLIYSKLKEEKFLSEQNELIYLDLDKIDNYLEENCI